MSNSQSQHWYDADGNAVHTQITKSGPNEGKERNTTLADAKKQGLFASVSAKTGVLDAPGLNRYIQEEIMKTAFSRPPIGGEDFKTWKEFITKEAQKEMDFSKAFGTEVHKGLEQFYGEPLLPREPYPMTLRDGSVYDRWEFMEPAIDKISELGLVIHDSEKIAVNHAYGYAGTTDLTFTTADSYGIIDFKTTKTKPGVKIKGYPDKAMQIAAYLAAIWGKDFDYPIGPKAVGHNIYISTTEVGRIELVSYDAKELKEAWEAYKHCLGLWRYVNDRENETG